MNPEYAAEMKRCRHGNGSHECRTCRTDESFLQMPDKALESGVLSKEEIADLSDDEQGAIQTIDWNVPEPNDIVGGAGFFSTGPMKAKGREAAVAEKIVTGFEKGGAHVQILPVDDLLLDPSPLDLVERVLAIGKEHGTRVAGKPRVIIVTGFSSSKLLHNEGIYGAIGQILNGQTDRKMGENLFRAPDKARAVASLPPEQAEMAWALQLAMRYAAISSWQAVASRKNNLKHDTIILMTVAPDEIYSLVNSFQTGRSTGLSDMVQRWREYIFVPPQKQEGP